MKKYLIKLTQIMEKKLILRHLFFAVSTAITIGFLGYYFGTFDQASHIPFLKKNFDPGLYPNDNFFSLRSSHYSFFWMFFLPFYRWGVLEIAMFCAHIFATYLTYWAIWRLTKTIFSNTLTSILSVVSFIFPHIGFAGFTVFEFSLLNRTFTLPFLLLAIDFYLKKVYWISFLILGIMYNFHVVSVNFILAMFLFDSILRIRKVGLKNFLIGIVLFFLAASPVFIWKSSNSHLDLGTHWQWYKTISNSILYHIFNLTAINPPIIFLTLGGIASLFIYFATNKYSPMPKKEVITNFVFAGLIVLLVQVITSNFYPVTIIIQSQIIRVGIFLLIFSYFNFSHFISNLIAKNKISDEQTSLLLLSLTLSVSPIILAAAFLGYKSKKILKPFIFVVIIGAVITYMTAIKLDLWRPGIHIYSDRLDGFAVQMWAKRNTPQDALFITPPHLWWFYSLEWRVISERSTIVTLSELLEGAFEPKYLNYWEKRFDDVAPGARKKFIGNTMDNFAQTAKSYYSLTEKDILRLANKYKAQYFVVEKPHRYAFSLVYEDKKFIVYKVR